jgi:hypothetical protein
MASLEDQVLLVLANQATIITNQAAILTAIQGITPGDSAGITAALAQIETQVSAINSQFTATPTPAPEPAPAPDTAA